MGTELEHSPNLFTIFPKNSYDVVPVGFSSPDSLISFSKRLQKTGIWSGSTHFQESMDISLECNRESLRKTMMNHEQIFKQQVFELHQLYKVQKILMAELRSKEVKLHPLRNVTPGDITDTRNKYWSSASTTEISHFSYISIRYPSADQSSSENSFLQLYNTRAGPSSRELSICSEDPFIMQKGFGLERSAVDDDSAVVTQNQTPLLLKHLKKKTSLEGPELYSDGESDIELTLSIGCGANKKKSKNWLPTNNDLRCSMLKHSKTRQLRTITPVIPEGREEHSDPSESFNREDLQGPPWLFRSLKLSKK